MCACFTPMYIYYMEYEGDAASDVRRLESVAAVATS